MAESLNLNNQVSKITIAANNQETYWLTAIFEETIDYLDIIQYTNSGTAKSFEFERKYLRDEIEYILNEITQNGKFTLFQNRLDTERRKQNRLNYKTSKIKENKSTIEELIKKYPTTKRESETQLGILEEKVELTKSKLEQVKVEQELESTLACEKLKHDVTVGKDLLTDQEAQIIKTKNELRASFRREMISNESVEAFLNIKIKVLRKERDNWQKLLYGQLKNNQYEIDKLENEVKNLKLILLEMTEECKIYMETIQEDTIEKLMLKQKLEQEAIEVKAITKVQAWWKGIMVRKGLGIYKKRKKKFKAKGKENKCQIMKIPKPVKNAKKK